MSFAASTLRAIRMVNLYPEIIPEGGKDAAYLQRCPGLRFLDTVGAGPIRGLWQQGAYGYVVSGSELYRVDSAYNNTLLGTVTGTGAVSMSDNGDQLFVACNPDGFIYNFNTLVFTQITDPDFPGAVNVGYLDGYFVFNEPNSQRFWVTAFFDGTSIDPLDFASAEGSPDNLVGLIIDHRECWLYGTNSTEVWYDAGTPDFPLERIQGAFNEVGCIAPYSIAKLDNGIFWLGADARGQGMVYRAVGYQAQRVSTHAVEFAIQSYGNMTDATAYTYQQDGHSFYVLIFPSAETTWVYDVATQGWHERAGFADGMFQRHRSNCQMVFNTDIVVGDYANGNLYAFDLNTYADNGDTQKWLRAWRALEGPNDFKRTAHHSLQIDFETGVGLTGKPGSPAIDLATESLILITTEDDVILTTEPYLPDTVGYDANVMLRWSDDSGHTWSNEHWISLGNIGRSWTRAIWRRLGMTEKLRDRVYEVSGTDPVKIAIMGAVLGVTPTSG